MKKATLKVFRSGQYEYLYVYYKEKGEIIRINTKHKYVKSYANIDLTFNAKKPDYKQVNKQLTTLLNKVNKYITHCHNNFVKVSQKDCKKYLGGELQYFDTYKENNYAIYYNMFLEDKKKDRAYKTIENYKILLHTLQDFEKFNKTALTINSINDTDFLKDFVKFLQKDLGDKYKTKGNASQNTIVKKIKEIKTFIAWCNEKKILSVNNVFNYSIKSFISPVFALSEKDVYNLYEYDYEKECERKIIEVFTFLCFTGMRYSDYELFNDFEFKNGIMIKHNKKTETRITIPILNVTRQILEKYDYKLPIYTHKHFRKKLKEILNKYDFFNEDEKKYYHKRDKIENIDVKRRDKVKVHTARSTFITMCVNNNVPVNTITAATGHTNSYILDKYIMKKDVTTNDFGNIGKQIKEKDLHFDIDWSIDDVEDVK